MYGENIPLCFRSFTVFQLLHCRPRAMQRGMETRWVETGRVKSVEPKHVCSFPLGKDVCKYQKPYLILHCNASVIFFN